MELIRKIRKVFQRNEIEKYNYFLNNLEYKINPAISLKTLQQNTKVFK